MTSDDRRHHGHCRGCGARVLWATTSNGRPIPLAPLPDAAGNFQITRDASGLRADMLTGDELQRRRDLGRWLHLPHAAVCPRRPRRQTRNLARLQ